MTFYQGCRLLGNDALMQVIADLALWFGGSVKEERIALAGAVEVLTDRFSAEDSAEMCREAGISEEVIKHFFIF